MNVDAEIFFLSIHFFVTKAYIIMYVFDLQFFLIIGMPMNHG